MPLSVNGLVGERAEELLKEQDEANTGQETVKVHCPFGCTLEDCDDHGYCRHLLGFTNDGKLYEPIAQRKTQSGEEDGIVMVVGRNRKNDPRKPVLKSDKLVNPEDSYYEKGLLHVRQAWVSSRVYREHPEPTDAELDKLTAPAKGA